MLAKTTICREYKKLPEVLKYLQDRLGELKEKGLLTDENSVTFEMTANLAVAQSPE